MDKRVDITHRLTASCPTMDFVRAGIPASCVVSGTGGLVVTEPAAAFVRPGGAGAGAWATGAAFGRGLSLTFR